MKRIAVATVFLLCAALLIGCADYSERKQAEAVAEAIAQMGKDTKAFFHFEYDGIIEQLKEQAAADSEFTFTLAVSVPDVAAIDAAEVAVNEPFCDYNKPNVASYETAYVKAASNAIAGYIEDAENLAYLPSALRFKLTKSGLDWTATYNEADLQTLVESLSTEIEAKAEAMLEYSEGYRKAQLAEHIKANMTDLFPDTQFAQNVKISGIERIDDGLAVTLRFPDPNAVYQAAAEACYREYSAMDAVYGYIDEADVAAAWQPHIASSITAGAAEDEAALIVMPDFAYGEGYDLLKNTVQAARKAGVDALIQKVNAELALVPSQRPKSGVMTGSSKGQTVTVIASDDLGDMYLAFYKLPGESLEDDGELALTAYVRSGDTITLRLLTGNYKMIEATGGDWFGEAIAFGPEGNYEVADALMTVETGFHYTLTLYGVSDGNLPTTTIPYPFGD